MHLSLQNCSVVCLFLAFVVLNADAFLLPERRARWMERKSSIYARSYSWISKPPKPPANSSPNAKRNGIKGRTPPKIDRLKVGERSRGNSSPNSQASETPIRLKPPESKFRTQHKRVERLVSLDQQKPLSEFEEGQELKGRVISFASYGMFVDIGTVIDGLVHIKDASNIYFIPDLSTRYQPGDEVTVWVKFVNPVERKLGLQLFSYTPPLERKYTWSDLSYEMPVQGKIVKFSENGAYIDIGGPKLGYMPRRSMKSNYRQRHMKPWELQQLNTVCECFIMQFDEDEGQLIVSTFPPTEWEKRFLLVGKTGRQSRTHLEERRKSNEDTIARTMGLEKKLVIGNDDDDNYMDEEEDEEDENEDEEEGSEDGTIPKNKGKDIKDSSTSDPKIENGWSDYKVILDDIGDSKIPSKSVSKSKPRKLNKGDGADDVPFGTTGVISTQDLFTQLGGGKPFITLKEVKKWVYLQQLVKGGHISYNDLPALFARAGGSSSLSFDEFNTFMEMFAELVGIETVYDDEEEDGEMRDARKMTSDNFMQLEREDGSDEESLEELVFGLDSPASAPAVNAKSTDFSNQPTGGSTLLETTYRQLVGKDKGLNADKLLRWDFCKAMLQSGQVDEDDLAEIAKNIMGKDKVMSLAHFQTFVDDLEQLSKDFKEMDNELTLEVDENERDEYDGIDEGDEDGLLENAKDDAKKHEEGNEFDNMDEAELMNKVFESLSEGRGYLTMKDLMKWDFVSNAIEEGYVSEKDIQSTLEKLSQSVKGEKAKGLDMESFDRFVDELIGKLEGSDDKK